MRLHNGAHGSTTLVGAVRLRAGMLREWRGVDATGRSELAKALPYSDSAHCTRRVRLSGLVRQTWSGNVTSDL